MLFSCNVYTTFCRPICLLMDTWVISIFWKLWTAAMNIGVQLCESLFSILLSICTEMELLDHMVVTFLVLMKDHHTVFHNGQTTLYSHQQCTEIPASLSIQLLCKFSTSLSTQLLCWIVAILLDVMWYLSGFGLHFPNDESYWVSFQCLSASCIWCEEVSLRTRGGF